MSANLKYVLCGLVVSGALVAAYLTQDEPPRLAPPLLQSEAAFFADRYERGCNAPTPAPRIYFDAFDNKVDVADITTWTVTLDEDVTQPRSGIAHGLAHLITQRRTGRPSMIHEADGFLVLEAFLVGHINTCPRS